MARNLDVSLCWLLANFPEGRIDPPGRPIEWTIVQYKDRSVLVSGMFVKVQAFIRPNSSATTLAHCVLSTGNDKLFANLIASLRLPIDEFLSKHNKFKWLSNHPEDFQKPAPRKPARHRRLPSRTSRR